MSLIHENTNLKKIGREDLIIHRTYKPIYTAGKDMERNREKDKGWAYFELVLYDNYDESKNHHENERLQGDVSSCDFFEVWDDVGGFYCMVIEYYKQNPVSGLRICEKGACDSLGSIDDG